MKNSIKILFVLTFFAVAISSCARKEGCPGKITFQNHGAKTTTTSLK